MEPVFTYKPRCAAKLMVPSVNDPETIVTITPSIITAKWTRNNHLTADELTITIGWEEGGCDPRFLKNATCEFYMWDDLRQDFKDNDLEFLRFKGICVKASRKLSQDTSEVTLTFHDYTTLFIHMKPFPTRGMPEYSDTLEQIWQKICDHTGTRDPGDSNKVVSSVTNLRNGLQVSSEGLKAKTLGSLVSDRFHAIAKPSIHQNANAWETWQWCVGALGAVSYIDGEKCVVMTTTEHYESDKIPGLIYGHNIWEFEENSDPKISGKGILLKSQNPLTGMQIESAYPPPGDERLKMTRAIANRAAKAGRDVNLNDVSGDYEEFLYYSIHDQAALDIRAKEAYEEFSRQQMEGTLKTSEMVLEGEDGEPVDILNLRANDSISIAIDPDIYQFKSAEETKQFLVEAKGYNDGLATIIAQNFMARELQSLIFHITSMDVDYQDGTCTIEIKYHNLVNKVEGTR